MVLNARRLDHLNLIVLAIRDITEERAARQRQDVLTGELQHRVKNILNNVPAGIVAQALCEILYIPYMTWRLLLPLESGKALCHEQGKRAAMQFYVGLDVSLKRTEICVVEETGRSHAGS